MQLKDEAIKIRIEKVISSKPVAVFMKGSPDFPQCGFSARACQILKAAGIDEEDLSFFDVLSDEAVRSGIKEYSQWPTIPQVYVNGQFIGGSDILMQMYDSGELEQLLKEEVFSRKKTLASPKLQTSQST